MYHICEPQGMEGQKGTQRERAGESERERGRKHKFKYTMRCGLEKQGNDLQQTAHLCTLLVSLVVPRLWTYSMVYGDLPSSQDRLSKICNLCKRYVDWAVHRGTYSRYWCLPLCPYYFLLVNLFIGFGSTCTQQSVAVILVASHEPSSDSKVSPFVRPIWEMAKQQNGRTIHQRYK